MCSKKTLKNLNKDFEYGDKNPICIYEQRQIVEKVEDSEQEEKMKEPLFKKKC